MQGKARFKYGYFMVFLKPKRADYLVNSHGKNDTSVRISMQICKENLKFQHISNMNIS